jgi:DNA-binding NtrC family response regulator/tetratricopeptide (TPR) repeat protein
MAMPLHALRGDSPGIVAIRTQVMQLLARQPGGRRPPPVLILGETGTGKGLLARTIHHAATRRDGAFVDVNCAAIPEPLLEVELFGYERGAFTDARQAKPGLFQTAHGGTLFLDEIGLLPAALQSKLLAVLEDRAVRRLGGTRPEPVDVALVAATSVDLKRAVSDGNFRGDLYHRLAVISFELPPLRARGADILALAEHFLVRACADYGLAPRALTSGARDLLVAYRWPGNVRELANAIERLVLLSDAPEITPAMLDFLAGDAHTGESVPPPDTKGAAGAGSLDDALRARIEAALRDRGGNIRRTAIALGISRNTLRARMDKYGLRHRDASPGLPERRAATALSKRRAAASGRWERRHLAFLRARLLSSSSVERSRALEVATEKVRSFGGRLEDSSPTDVVGVFGLEPVENAPSHAALAALATQKAVADARAAGERAAVIIAIHCADHLVRHDEAGLEIGVDSKAGTWSMLEMLVTGHRPGAIVVSGAVVPFLTRRFALERLSEVAGDVWMVHRRGGAPSTRSTTRFVGRSAELEALRQARGRVEQRQGQVVGIVGEAGVGKSRLLDEAVRQLPGWLVLAAGGAPYAKNTSYLPLVELFKSYCQIQDTDAAPAVRESVAKKLPAGAGDRGWLLPPILDLLGVLPTEDAFRLADAPQRRQRMHDAIKQVLLAASTEQPLCLIVEDLHWIDAHTQAVVDLLTESIALSRVLLLVNYRPEYQHGWGGRSNYTQIRLDPFPAEEVDELLVALLGRDPSLDPVKQMLKTRTEGNPFFIEECARALAENQSLIGEVSQYRLGTAPRHVALPLTVQAVIATRINRLSAQEKTVLQSAAVIGKDVRVGILRSIAGVSDEAFEAILQSLRRAEFMHETRVYPDLDYTFKHVLTHEVVYDSLLPETRRELHSRIVDAIERLDHDRLAEHVERLAQHALRGAVWPKAVAYLRQAAVKAVARSANLEAVNCLEQALNALPQLPQSPATREQAIDIRLALQIPLNILGEIERLLVYLREAESLARVHGDLHRIGRVAAYMAWGLNATGRPEQAAAFGEQALATARTVGDRGLEVIANVRLGMAYSLVGAYPRAIAGFKRNVDALVGDRPTERVELPGLPAIVCRAHMAGCLAELGEFPAALAAADEAVRMAEAADDRWGLVLSQSRLGLIYLRQGDLEGAVPWLERSLDGSRRFNFEILRLMAAGPLGEARAARGETGEALALLEQAAEQAASIRVVGHLSGILGALGEGYLFASRLAEARHTAERMLDLTRASGDRHLKGHALRILGGVHAQANPVEAGRAEAAYREALGIAEEIETRPLAARCHLGLGMLYRATGQPESAENHLATAATMFRDMAMRSWLEKAMAAMGEGSR